MLADQWFPYFDASKTLEEDRAFDFLERPLGLRSIPRGTFPAVNVYQQGDAIVLTVRIGKAEQAKPRKIRIGAAE